MNEASYLSFMNTSRYARCVDHWSPEVTDDWGVDTAQGKVYADEAIAFIRVKQNPTVIGHVIKAMIGRGAWTGVEVGFFHRISEHLLIGVILDTAAPEEDPVTHDDCETQ